MNELAAAGREALDFTGDDASDPQRLAGRYPHRRTAARLHRLRLCAHDGAAARPVHGTVARGSLAIGLQLCGGLLDLRSASRDCHWASLKWLIAGAAIGSPIGVLLLSAAPVSIARLAIAAATAAAVLTLGKGGSLRTAPPRAATALVGLTAGVFNGLAAMPGPPAVIYYLSTPLSRAATRGSLLVFFFATSISAMVSITAVGLLDRQLLALSLIGLPVMMSATFVGELAFRHGSDSLHRRSSPLQVLAQSRC